MLTFESELMVTDIELFRGLNPLELERVEMMLRSKAYPAGANLILAETPGEVVYIIEQGSLKIHIDQADGRDVILAILGPGDIVGEMSLIDSAGRSASVVTLEESQLMWISGRDFQDCLRTMPIMAQNLVRILASRVRLANELIQALAHLDVHGRVARQLLAFADKYGQSSDEGVIIPLRLTQGDIADLVGASRKRVNQVMVTFKENGYIAVDEKGCISVLDRKSLVRLCR